MMTPSSPHTKRKERGISRESTMYSSQQQGNNTSTDNAIMDHLTLESILPLANPHSILSQQLQERLKEQGMKMTLAHSSTSCQNCYKLLKKPLVCASCKTTAYCSKECQITAWKKGHRGECKRLSQARKDEKQKQKATLKQEGVPSAETYLDANLDADLLWDQGVALVAEKDYQEAVWKFTVSSFLKYSQNAEKLVPVNEAVKACLTSAESNHPVTLALSLLTAACPKNKWMEHVLGIADKYDTSAHYVDSAQSLEEVDRMKFGLGMCYIFATRIISWDTDGMSVEERRETFLKASQIAEKARQHMDMNRWLSVYLDFGYNAYECVGVKAGSLEESRLWFTKLSKGIKGVEKFRGGTLPNFLNPFKCSCEWYLEHIPLLETAIKRGAMMIEFKTREDGTVEQIVRGVHTK